MNKTKKIYFLISVFVFSAVSLAAVSQQALANGSATVSWIAPATDQGGGDLTGLSGYRVYYSTSAIDCTDWDAADVSARLADAGTLLPATYSTVTEAATLRDSADATKRGYTFSTNTLLTPGQTYNFAVVAYDNADDVNYSECATYTESPSKLVYHSGNFKNSGVVSLSDLSVLAGDFGKTSWCRIAGHAADINGDCTVGISDLSIFAAEWGL